MRAPARRLRAGDRLLELGVRPVLSGVLGAVPAWGAGGTCDGTLDAQLGLARDLLGAGADILDLEVVPGRVGLAPADPREEIERVAERVAALTERVVAELGALVSVHTDEPLVAARAIAAGACILNGAGARHGGELAQLCAQTGAALVLLREHVEQALAIGVVREQLVLDPGPALARTPAEAIVVLADLERLHALGAPLLVDLSRDELLGQPSGAPPCAGGAPVLAALATGLDAGAQLFRVTDVSAASDFLTVRAALSGELLPSRDLELPEELRYERSAVE